MIEEAAVNFVDYNEKVHIDDEGRVIPEAGIEPRDGDGDKVLKQSITIAENTLLEEKVDHHDIAQILNDEEAN